MRFEEQGVTDRYYFDSWLDYVDSVSTMKAKRSYHDSTITDSRTPPWYGTKTWDEAIELGRYGWPDGASRVDALKGAIVDRIAGTIRVHEPVYDVTGLAFDMGRVMSGEPECWLRWEETSREREAYKPTVCRIVYNQTVSCNVSTETVEARGAAVMALVELLELAGVRAEVTLGFVESEDTKGRHARKTNIYSTELIKAADERPNRDVLAFALVNAATFRRFGFRVIEHSPRYHDISSYGYPMEIPDDERGDIYIGEAYGSDIAWNDPETVDNWLREQMTKQGIEFVE